MPNLVTTGESGDIYATHYKSYVALISQTGTAAPTVIVMNSDDSNYLGDLVWTRDDIGFYFGTLAGVFTTDRSWIQIQDVQSSDVGKTIAIIQDNDSVQIYTSDPSGVATDNLLAANSIEIRVYL